MFVIVCMEETLSNDVLLVFAVPSVHSRKYRCRYGYGYGKCENYNILTDIFSINGKRCFSYMKPINSGLSDGHFAILPVFSDHCNLTKL